ncbi:MAG: TonB-dependent receptor [Pyrinomonadaceae bacterium MAG19_C2-C3]|nr:TonB-dependent receptor [Pyrinomonadaceae bacterium MAG19_C2-C3]
MLITNSIAALCFSLVVTCFAHAQSSTAQPTPLPTPTLSEEVIISATRTENRLSDTAASVIVINREQLATTAAVTIDDRLRQVPGFQLFRRAGSRTANPTAQGVSLRGLGASGASRASVLYDGVPLNDPFGGWVYWGRVPRAEVESVEILRGGASDLYGGAALSGVVALNSRRDVEQGSPSFEFETSFGSQRTPDATLWTGVQFGKWRAYFGGEALRTDGYIIVDEDERGGIDTAVNVRRAGFDVMLERELKIFDNDGRAFVRGAYYAEGRGNGTPLQTNKTRVRSLSSGANFGAPFIGAVQARLYGSTQGYDQVFSAIALDRESENLTRVQRVPAQSLGFSFQASRIVGARHTVVGGIDGRTVRGTSDETVFVQGRASSLVSAGGRERAFGIFAADVFRVNNRIITTFGARFDCWHNYDAASQTAPVNNPVAVTTNVFTDRTEQAFSPRASILVKATDTISLTSSFSRAFRQPTLNELYRAFRVGNVLTLANENLLPERATTGEAGAIFTAPNRRLSARTVFFITDVTQPVANVTLSFTSSLITRQRQNLGRTRTRGLETEAEARISDDLVISGGYLFADARVKEFPANVGLENLRVPQVARHQFTIQARIVKPRFATVGIQARAASSQFDDDQNLLPLNRFFTVDVFASRRVTKMLDAFVAVENITDARIETGRTPVSTLGAPPLVRVGIKLRSGR